jgi:hypothetical protein
MISTLVDGAVDLGGGFDTAEGLALRFQWAR